MSTSLRLARFRQACWWLQLNIHLVPLKPFSKHIQPGFGPHQAHITSPDQASRWFLHSDANLAVVLGGPLGLIACDWDRPEDYFTWLSAQTDHPVSTLTERTARGYHAFFFAPALPSASALGCELKASGVCMVSPSVHPSRFLYRIIHPPPIAALPPDLARSLFPFLSHSLPLQLLSPSTPGSTPSATSATIPRIKAAFPTFSLMQSAGLALRPAGCSVLIALCPFHPDHSPSLWLNPSSNLWGCNSPACPASGTHDAINFYALHHNISNSQAIRQLAALLPPS